MTWHGARVVGAAACEQGPADLEDAFGEPFMSRWVFDVELLVRLIREVQDRYPQLDIYLEPGEAIASGGGVLVWAVHAHNKRLYPGDLRGTYTGASGNIALGLGVGGNVLIGGSHNTVALQPLSGEGNIGVGLSVGVGQLVLN